MENKIYLHRGCSNDANIRYFTQINDDVDISDKFYIIKNENEKIALIGGVDKRKLNKHGNLSKIITFGKFSDSDIRGNIEEETKVLNEFLKQYKEQKIITGPKFPSYIFNELEKNYNIKSLRENPIAKERKIKKDYEIENLREIQKITENGMKHIKNILDESSVNNEDILEWQNNILTSEILRKEVEKFFNEYNASMEIKYIIATGKNSADPHERGNGPIKANVPILIDLFPKSNSGYYGDMSRTFIKGEPSQEFKNMSNAINDALNSALNIIQDGITANEIHNKVCEVLENHGYDTGVNKDNGFTHSTGHSIGLEIHETPRISGESKEIKENMILTIEPGLYYDSIGGLRIEDMIRVKKDGFENFNTMNKEIIQSEI